MTTTTIAPSVGEATEPRKTIIVRGWQDHLFRALARSGGTLVLTLMGLVGLFLIIRGSSAINVAGWSFLTTQAWDPNSHHFGIAAVLSGTIIIAVIAIVIAVPMALGTSTYISEYAPLALRRFLIGTVDLMAAIPSVVYGLWGFFFLDEAIVPIAQWISTNSTRMTRWQARRFSPPARSSPASSSP